MYCSLMKKEHDLAVLIQEERNTLFETRMAGKAQASSFISFSEADSEAIAPLDGRAQPVPG